SFFFTSRRRHTRFSRDWSSDVCSSDLQAQQLSGARIVASHYADRKGVPAVFHSSLFPQLLNLKGDTGAKHIIEALEDEVLVVSFPQGAVDVDTEEAYGQILADS